MIYGPNIWNTPPAYPPKKQFILPLARWIALPGGCRCMVQKLRNGNTHGRILLASAGWMWGGAGWGLRCKLLGTTSIQKVADVGMAHVTYVRPRTLIQFSHGGLPVFHLTIPYHFLRYKIYDEEIPKHNCGFRYLWYLVSWLLNGYHISMGSVNFNLFGLGSLLWQDLSGPFCPAHCEHQRPSYEWPPHGALGPFTVPARPWNLGLHSRGCGRSLSNGGPRPRLQLPSGWEGTWTSFSLASIHATWGTIGPDKTP